MHRFINFKGFANAELDLFQPLTVLIGPNGSGKSNAIEGVELLSFIAHGRPIHEVADVAKNGNIMQVRGGLQLCPRHGQNHFGLGFSGTIGFRGVRKPFEYSVTIDVKPHPRINEEKLDFTDGTMIFETLSRPRGAATSADIEVRYNNFARGWQKPIAFVAGNRSVLSQYEGFAKENNLAFDECLGLVKGLMSYLQSSFVFDPNPKSMRTYERIGNNILLKDGSNLSAVLYALKNGTKEQKGALDKLLHWIKQVPEEPYQDISFVKTELNDVIFGFQEASGHLSDARMLSDGTLRSLAVLTALVTVDPNSRVVIEEFDNGLHPSRVQVLTNAISQCCKERGLNILVTTHNPATLNALSVEQLEGVVLCVWDTVEKYFKLIRLQDLPRHDELFERGRLGDLVSRRILEQYLAPDFEEKRRAKAQEWLRSLP
jgi:predicted ATPase